MTSLQRFFALLALCLLAGCAALESAVDFDEPEVELLGLEPLPARGMEARFLLRLRIVNPNSVALDIDGMAYDVYLNDSKVLSGVSNRELRVDPYSESTAELEVAAGMLGSMRLLRDLMQNPPQGGLPYRLNAKISRKGLGGTLRVSREGLLGMESI
jgi:LEA14-like dessication related protein